MTTQDELGQRGYQYKHGDRPLDGYTIERAAGRGGFGEVYYAHSDSGREVALKVVNTYEQVELRGISQCMNLKNPHLVTIFDVKYGSDGRPWVIMEYVSGPSLREILDAAPSGLGAAKSAFFLREVGKGLTYLHDCGIVHRDLKPGNIFFENGYVKIGDYGLSKAMSMTRHSGQTVAVGTLHYMAPEIGEGKYDRSIDIYALGALLYEMLTGQVPFLGSSPAEVLMKHLRAEVSLDGIDEPFKSVIRKAMAKNPDDRYRSVQEMVEAVFGSEDVRNSVSQFSPTALTMMAGQAARKIGDDAAVGATRAPFEQFDEWTQRVFKKPFGGKKGQAWFREGAALEPDRLSLPVRILMALGVALAAEVLTAAMSRSWYGPGVFFAIVSASFAAKLAWQFIGRSIENESDWVRRIALGTPTALAAWPFCYAISRHPQTLPLAVCATLFLLCWRRRLSPLRKERVIGNDAFTAGLCGFLVSMFTGTTAIPVIAVAVGTSVAVSLLSPWGRQLASKAAAATSPSSTPPQGIAPPRTSPSNFTDAGKTFKAQLKNNLKLSKGNRPFPGWVIVAIVLGVVATSSHGNHAPWALFPFIIALIIVVAALNRTSGMRAAGAGIADGSAARSSFREVASSAAHGVVSTVGGMFLVASILLAVAVVADIPGLLQSPLVGPAARRQLEQALGQDWPRLLREFGIVACIVLGWVALLLTLAGRRWGGPAHMLRAVLGIGIIFAAIASLGRGLPPWSAITPRDNTPGAIADFYVQHIDVNHAIWAGIVYLAGWFLLVWPAKRHQPVSVYQPAPAPEEPKKENPVP